MTKSFRIKLTETTTAVGSAELAITSESPEMAAAEMLIAYQTAKTAGSNMLQLRNGQRELLERDEIVSASVRFELLDQDGAVIREITQASRHRSLN